MEKSRNKSKTKVIKISSSVEVFEYLNDIAETGIYGKTASEVARRFVENKIGELLSPQILKLRKRKRDKDKNK